MFIKLTYNLWQFVLNNPTKYADNELLKIPDNCNAICLAHSNGKLVFYTANVINGWQEHTGYIDTVFVDDFAYGSLLKWSGLLFGVNPDSSVSLYCDVNLDRTSLLHLGKVTKTGMVITELYGAVSCSNTSELYEVANMLKGKSPISIVNENEASISMEQDDFLVTKCLIAAIFLFAFSHLAYAYWHSVLASLHTFDTWMLGAEISKSVVINCTVGIVGILIACGILYAATKLLAAGYRRCKDIYKNSSLICRTHSPKNDYIYRLDLNYDEL